MRISTCLLSALVVLSPFETKAQSGSNTNPHRAAYVTLFGDFCIDLKKPGSCIREYITDNKIDPALTYSDCIGVSALVSVKKFWKEHPVYHTWEIKGATCETGNQPSIEAGRKNA